MSDSTSTTPVIRAVAYLRVSTDDKGQDPERQMEIITPWAAREGVSIVDVVIDLGTSATKTDPFSRKKFIAACERAGALGADAVVVEAADRFGRQGSKEAGYAEGVLRRRYALRLLRADKPVALHGSMVGDVTDALKDEVAREAMREHGKKVRSGMAKKKKDGARYGRPPKPLSHGELDLVTQLRAEGKGWRRVALAISEARGAFRIADPKRSKALRVSHSHVRRCSG